MDQFYARNKYGGEIVKFGLVRVKKRFFDTGVNSRAMAHMRHVYHLLADLKVPNVDHMVIEKRCSVILEPRGEKCAIYTLRLLISDLVSAVKYVVTLGQLGIKLSLKIRTI
jgi:hypothetical protein